MTQRSLLPFSSSQVALIVIAALFGLRYSLSVTIIALDLAKMGLSESMIGLNAAMGALGALATAFLLPRLTAFWGMRRTMLVALALASGLFAILPAMPYGLWFPLRFLLGAAAAALFILAESWLNALSPEGTRGRTMGAYTAAVSFGIALGPLLLSFIGTEGYFPYLAGAGLTALAALFVAPARVHAPVIDKPTRSNPFNYMRLAPLALVAAALNAAIETAGLTFLPLYAITLGWQELQATQLMSFMMLGAIALQFPIGWLGDRMDRRRLIILLSGMVALSTLLWPVALGHPVFAYVLLFLCGGAFVGIYTIVLTIVGSRFKGSELIGIYAAMGFMWGVGALLGALLVGMAMHITLHGLAFFVAAACAAFMVMALRWTKL